ncbi:MAG: hypothetical protein RL514_917 [Verrucomicrobiota bacterium]|jgi:hypothetical protein
MMKKISTLVVAGAGAMLMAQSAQATLAYSNGDMLLGFRKDSQSSNLEVNLGSVNQIINILGTGQTLSFSSKFTSGDITAGVGTAGSGSLNSAIWSVSAGINALNQSGITAPNRTLWLTSGRGVNSADINTQTTPLQRASLSTQGNTVSPLLTIGTGFAAATGNAGSTTAAVVANGANSYADNIGSGNFGTFDSNIENTLGASFTSGGSVARSDYYQLTPGSGNGTYLGYFELSQGGALSFVAVPESGTFAASIGAGLMALALLRAHRKSLASA